MNRAIFSFVFTVFLLPLTSQNLKYISVQEKTTYELPSGSGMAVVNDGIYCVGDDSPYLFLLNHQFEIQQKWAIAPFDTLINNRLPKKTKPDYEALEALGDTALLAFSSGSKSPHRDWFIYIDLTEEQPIFSNYNISRFYDYLRQLPEIKGEINIEAVTFLGPYTLLFDRNTNTIFQFPTLELLNHLTKDAALPAFSMHTYDLPSIKGNPSTFSGATTSKDETQIIFSASVEATSNAYDDGKVLGSFIGIIDIKNNQLNPNLAAVVQLPSSKNKIESVTIHKEKSNGRYELFLIADNDDGSSVLLKSVIVFPAKESD